jgi:hypothetical protein
MNPIEPVEVYTTFSPPEAEIIRTMLDAEGIDAEVAGDSQGGFPGALPEIAVMVHATDLARARDLIAEHQANRSPESAEAE